MNALRRARDRVAASARALNARLDPGSLGGDGARGLSLRVRLTISVAALMAVVVAVLGVTTGLVLRGYLVHSLDDDLRGVTDRAVRAVQTPANPMGPGSAIGIPGQSAGTLAAFIAGNQIRIAGVLDDRGETVSLSDADLAALPEAINGRQVGAAFDAGVGSLGEYRFTSVALGDGQVLLLGLPTSEVDGVVGQYALLAGIVGLGVLLVAAAGAFLIGTRLQRTTTRLESALAAREASETRLRRFAADASHELRTPLAAIRGYAELTRRSGARLRNDVAHSLERIESESVRMTGLVEDLLLLARLDESQPLAAEPVELSALVATAVGDIQVSAPDHEWSVDAPDPVTVTGDEARLHQAVVNLLSNAAKHTPPGTSVVARARVVDGAAIIEVEDDGPGIPPQLLPDIFGRFVRGDASRARIGGANAPSGSSTGLGLAIVEAVATAHGGTASVESSPARTVFRIRIPSN